MAETDFPYTQSYKKIPDFFAKIQSAAVPSKFTQKVLVETMEFKGTNDRPLLNILRSLGFIDASGVPTQTYYDYKNKEKASQIMGKCLKSCYATLYNKDESFHMLTESQIKGHFESTTGKESNNAVLIQMVKTFMQLKSIASFNTSQSDDVEQSSSANISVTSNPNSTYVPNSTSKDFVLTHTIVLNLPVSTDQKVYDVLFRSIKENLL